MESKPIYKSKINWAAVLSILIAAAPLAVDLVARIKPDWTAYATAVGGFVVGVAIIVFRTFYTDKTIE
jgi:hypothetical protein